MWGDALTCRVLACWHANFLRRRFTEIGQILTGNTAATAEDGCSWVEALCEELAVPGLAEYGVTEAHFEAIIAKAAKSSRCGTRKSLARAFQTTPHCCRHFCSALPV